MFRRQLLQSSRSISRQISQTPRNQHSATSQFSSLSTRTARTAPSIQSQHLSRRWQSTETAKSDETKDKISDSAGTQTDAGATAASDQSATLKQEIEKQKTEIKDLKVCAWLLTILHYAHRVLTPHLGQVSTLCSRLPQPPRSNTTRFRQRP